MALVRTVDGTYREVYVENILFNGGQPPQTVVTGINPRRVLPGENPLDFVEVYLYIDSIVGSPAFPDPTVALDPPTGNIAVTYQNTAPAGNLATFTLDVRLNHSMIR